MSVAVVLVSLVVVVLAGTALASRLSVPAPLLLTVLGLGIGLMPFVPDVEITAELVLVGLLPPLLYSAAIRTSLLDFRANTRPIALLSVGLVIFTTLGVGAVAQALLPISWAAAFAIGAVVAPPDAVAATSIARRVGMPRRIVTILEGESLVNDATALVCLRTATAAILAASAVSGAGGGGDEPGLDLAELGLIGLDFAWAAGAGVAVGLAVAYVFSKIRRRLTDTVSDTTLSLIAPWVAFLPAEQIHASGVLAVVVAGLLMGHKAPVVQSAASRISERTYWRTISHLLENSVFLLIGLQARRIVSDVGSSDLGLVTIVVACVGVLLAVVLLRPLWVFPATYLPRRLRGVREKDPAPPWQFVAVVSWAGMRGVVTLAAVFALPAETEHREVLVLIALVVTFATLLLQGSTLPWLVRRLDVHGPDPLEDRLQEAAVLQDATAAGLRVLDAEMDAAAGSEGDPDGTLTNLRLQSQRRTHLAWELLGERTPQDESPTRRALRLRREMLAAEHAEVLRIRDEGVVAHEVLERVMTLLDLEESVLVGADERWDPQEHHGDLLAPQRPGGQCEHLLAAPAALRPSTPGVCPDCVRDGLTWVHLRMCLDCGNVGCCDSSPGQHADAHFSRTGHPVMRSIEAGEAWRWCYRDSELG